MVFESDLVSELSKLGKSGSVARGYPGGEWFGGQVWLKQRFSEILQAKCNDQILD